MERSNQRRQQFIDRPIQGALVARVVLYWMVTLLTQVLIMVFFAVIFSAPDDFYVRGQQLRTCLNLAGLAAALVLPLILIDVVRLSHRWVGPIFRLRAAMNALSRGERVPPIRFRERDYWQELAGDFNVVAVELNRRRAASPGDTATENLDPLAPAETES